MAHIAGFGGRGGFGRRPALAVIDMTLGFTDPESPLACDLEEPVANIAKILEASRRAEIPVVFTTVAYRESDKLTAAAFIEKIPALLTLEAGTRWAEIDPRIVPPRDRTRPKQALCLRFFRHRPPQPAHRRRRGYARSNRRLDLRLCPGHRRRRPAIRLSARDNRAKPSATATQPPTNQTSTMWMPSTAM